MSDPLADAADSLIAAGLDPETVRAVLRAVRHRWAGQTYIKSKDPDRDAEIMERLQRGEPTERIARSVGVHPSTIRRRRSRWL